MRAVRRLSRRRRARSPSSLLRMSALAIMGTAECVVSAYAVMQRFLYFPRRRYKVERGTGEEKEKVRN